MIADSMFFNAIRWIFLHEESHYRLGHLDYLRHVRKNEIGAISLSEYSLNISSESRLNTTPIIEWEADRSASQISADMILQNNPILHEMIPDYIKVGEFWQVRYLIATLGISTIALDEGRFHAGHPPNYPTVKVRLCTIMQSILLRMLSKEFEGDIRLISKSGNFQIDLLILFVERVSEAFNDIHTVYELIKSDDNRDQFDFEPLLLSKTHAYLMGIFYTYLGLEKSVTGDVQKKYIMQIMKIHIDIIGININDPENAECVSNILDTLNEYFSLYDSDRFEFWDIFSPFRDRCTP